MLLNIKKDDEVIFPSYGYVSTVNAFVKGAKPIFVDINSEDLNIDISQIEKIGKKTKAVVIINYAGGSVISIKLSIKEKYNLYLIEDALIYIFNKNKHWNIWRLSNHVVSPN